MNFEEKRKNLVEYLKNIGLLKNKLIENALLSVPREIFVPDEYKNASYDDVALPIHYGQTISQPSTIVIMLTLLDPKPKEKILEVGSGSGYVCALLSNIVGKGGFVYGTEIVYELYEKSLKNLDQLKLENIKIINKDGSLGLDEYAPFDRILISCACPDFPKPLVENLGKNGTMVAPIGGEDYQILKILKKNKKIKIKEYLEYFSFVPLRGKYGFEIKEDITRKFIT